MKDYRFRIGLVLTAAWLFYTGYMLHSRPEPSDLSAWGNFLAGFASPVAFLWLILGYMQQGEELKHSTKALQLQAEELRHSVEQQMQMVRITREQLAHDQEVLKEQRERRREAAKPRFVVQAGGSTSGGGVFEPRFVVYNLGAAATQIQLRFEPQFGRQPVFELGAMSHQQEKGVQLVIDRPKATTTKGLFTYVDADGLPGEARFDVELSAEMRFFLGPVRTVG